MKLFRFLAVLFIFGSLPGLHADERSAEELFFDANVRAADENHTEAVALYRAAIAKRPSANLHYNLGNAYYHLGEWGRARVHWEKALAMEPRHAYAGRNLGRLLRERALSETPPGFWLKRAWILAYNQWVWLGAGSFWLISFSLLAKSWKKNRWFCLPAGLGAVGLLVAFGAILLLSPTRQHAIILDHEATLQVAPAPESPVAAPLRPAQRVRVAGRYGNFVRVLLENGQEGFVPSDQLEKIW